MKKQLHLVDLGKKKCVVCGKKLAAMNLDGKDKKNKPELYTESKLTYDLAMKDKQYKQCKNKVAK